MVREREREREREGERKKMLGRNSLAFIIYFMLMRMFFSLFKVRAGVRNTRSVSAFSDRSMENVSKFIVLRKVS